MRAARTGRPAIGFDPGWTLRLCLILLWPLLVAGSCASDASTTPNLEPLALVSADGTSHTVQVEVMRTPRQLWIGLRWRKQMAADRGMLFDLGEVRQAVFTMDETLIPLDMLFIGADGRIVNIEAKTVPGNRGPYLSKGPVRAVLEINAGTAERFDVKPGDLVRSELFGNAPAP